MLCVFISQQTGWMNYNYREVFCLFWADSKYSDITQLCNTNIQCWLSESSLQGTVLGILSGQQSLFTQHLTPQQQQMYQQHMQLQHQAQHLKKIRRSLPHSTSDQGQQIHQQVCVNWTTFTAGDLNLKFFHTCQLCLSLCVPSFLRVAEGFLIWHTVFSWSQKSFYRFLP